MESLSAEHVAFAVAFLDQLVTSRGLTQTQLEQLSSVKQSQISKILKRQADPTPEVLRKLFQAMGLKLDDILHEAPASSGGDLLGYLATPLTAVAREPGANTELERVVAEIRKMASSDGFANPRFDLYWPGDHTHPVRNPEFKPSQVYLTDRSRASTFDFITLFCASPSYGVGQENEIATQAGLPAIRLLPEAVSRMISGSFLQAIDVRYSGGLDSKVVIDAAGFVAALGRVRKAYFRHRALYRSLNGNDFGPRLRKLLDDRTGDYQTFADDLGINLLYLQSLMDEPFTVSNPSARLLKRMSALLGVSVGYLLGETIETDPVLTESRATWNSWIENAPNLQAAVANRVKRDWQEDYSRTRKEPLAASFRNMSGIMREADWDKLYQEALKKERGNHRGQQAGLFGER